MVIVFKPGAPEDSKAKMKQKCKILLDGIKR